mmetsp:Transcript_15829/g.20812  ORF Transcript_15829/g.20812 Transcript_15829/m.20812 type:complete len:92 (-) Transcript_15829:27-302(-)|eukprot:CAMPEP_0197323080 /NCGR_PEP_ID=MMETSP0891-20130614/70293_1 /TAXON_ID=44058 ORGANISM="Aureoumbra lagunensis, Strain CCMP1510" /NCGR_SAMPLE_ID=MMETSP0891 /ASSEMBLY_ACC=CAM_ASM_000534 /LENGTH=91 /DNA_ID=CAMNT_0042815629 /DNA_START=284 /DNA_END=559 /DNA_ORIENTATION=+
MDVDSVPAAQPSATENECGGKDAVNDDEKINNATQMHVDEDTESSNADYQSSQEIDCSVHSAESKLLNLLMKPLSILQMMKHLISCLLSSA